MSIFKHQYVMCEQKLLMCVSKLSLYYAINMPLAENQALQNIFSTVTHILPLVFVPHQEKCRRLQDGNNIMTALHQYAVQCRECGERDLAQCKIMNRRDKQECCKLLYHIGYHVTALDLYAMCRLLSMENPACNAKCFIFNVNSPTRRMPMKEKSKSWNDTQVANYRYLQMNSSTPGTALSCGMQVSYHANGVFARRWSCS